MKNLLFFALISITLLSCESKEHRMYRLAEKAVRAHFKNPDEPKFGANPDKVSYNQDANSFTVEGTVEAKNLLGLPLTDKWFVVLQSKSDKPSFNNDDNWQVTDVEFASEVEKRQQKEAELREKKAIQVVKTDSKYNDVLDGYTVYATVQNTSAKLLEYGSLQATFYDKNNNVVGTGTGIINNLPANEARVIEIMATNVPNAARFDVQVDNVNFH
ncbi:MAG TPA: FxLYD domain-containing protein [Flavipsychrobacter sp.]|nr:FxLYD domain-containing protein [Flavipsychrobacter sp.]